MADSLITPEVRALIGTESEPEKNKFGLSDEMAYDLADATEDPNPLYIDKAKKAEGKPSPSNRHSVSEPFSHPLLPLDADI